MYSSSLYNDSNFSNSIRYGQSFPCHNFNSYNNHYITEKIYDDHRFERRKLQKPGFLIKQQKIYPDTSSYSIGFALDYASNLVKPQNNRFYSQDAEEQRVRVQGINPFSSNDRYISDLSQASYMKKSSRSRLDTNPNLGVTSYQVLEQSHQPQSYSKRQNQKGQNPSSFRKQAMQEYISGSLLDNFGKNTQSGIVKRTGSMMVDNPKIIREEEDSDQQMFYQRSKRQTFNPERNTKFNASKSTIVRLKQNPQLLVYKGKKFVKLIM